MKLAGFLLSLTTTVTQVQSLEAPLEGYEVAEFGWEVQSSPEGPLHHINGTIQDVVEYLKEVNPAYEVPEVPVAELDSRQSLVEPRQLKVGCYGWALANANDIQHGINYLKRVAGKPSNGPGPGACGRVSCSYDAAIWWCNDNRVTYTLPSFKNIADGAQNVKNKCTSNGRTSGQGFFDGNWNVIVRKDKC
ncbi:hypothetical protein INS49_010658 [Diaporthe citri]|uniref:uncharacterized protein n=1 Tax=Diaporthe citri TaxID=83186 RepID=UPI001C7E968E|nr:uncharacterized protein INS49_010658 [Diaporthe citri]KAG6362428.1 hypothetical protein INS49_010658 [Diaporthe citri]